MCQFIAEIIYPFKYWMGYTQISIKGLTFIMFQQMFEL